MNIQEALDLADGMKPNMMTRQTKIHFLQEIDQKIYTEILLTHEHEEEEEVMPEYDTDPDDGTELLVPDPYSSLYPFWIMSRIDLLNQELDKYNNDRALFENAYNEMHDWWNRTKMPVQQNRQLWI
ncbi:MAG: hypothetical protein J6Y48_17155 [Clostridia bacterium]|nr:hypothetical protein [Clostridia bacterium]